SDLSGNSFGLGIKVGSLSMCHPSEPFLERAAQRWDRPRRSSTRQSSRVVPSASSVAPALNTLLIGYGQSLLVSIGLVGWRRRSGSMRVLKRLIDVFVGMVMTRCPLVQAPAEIAFRGVPSRTTALIQLPGSHWRVRDAGRLG